MVGHSGRSIKLAPKENRRIGDLKQKIVDAIISSRLRTKALTKSSYTRNFLRQYFADVPVDDLQGRSEKIMARAALDHLEFGAKRRRGQALLRIFNPSEKEHGYSSNFTIIEMVNDDMPFLVDSVAAAVMRHNLVVHITVHPIISLLRDADGQLSAITRPGQKGSTSESFIRLAIERATDADELKILRQEIVKVLGDVRLAVRDWTKMRERMLESRDLLQYGPKGSDPLLRTESQALLD